MSWKARRFQPGKPILRAVRHRKKTITEALSGEFAPPSESEINQAIQFASDAKLPRWLAILRLAREHPDLLKDRNDYREAYLEEMAETSRWKFMYLMERQKVLGLQRKIGSLRQSRQLSRTRMRAGGRTTPTTSRSSKR